MISEFFPCPGLEHSIPADLALSCTAELSIILVEQSEMAVAVHTIYCCIRELVSTIFQCYPSMVDTILSCADWRLWEARPTEDAFVSKILDLRFCHCAAIIAPSFQPLPTDMEDVFPAEHQKCELGIPSLLKLHSAIAKVIEWKGWIRMHGKWLALAKRCVLLYAVRAQT